MIRTADIVAALLAAAMLAGCASPDAPPTGPYETVRADVDRDTEAARRHNDRAVELLGCSDLASAEAELKAALAADLYFAPAHNNLGTVYLRQKQFYPAAWEFQYAIKLTPKKATPRNNLGLVYEAVGRLDDAATCYTEALALNSDAVEITANLARVRIRTGQKDASTRQLLEDVVLKDTRPEWVNWARQQLVLLPKGDATGGD